MSDDTTAWRRQCPACQGRNGRPAFEVAGYAIRHCADCGSRYVERPPSPEQVRDLYLAPAYYDIGASSSARIENENRRRLAIANRYISSGRVLDIGCAKGGFLDLARAQGFETHGVELSPRNAEVARGHGHRVFVGTFEEYLRTRPPSFDLVACLDVIEHVPDPGSFMLGIAGILAPGGLVVMSTPNYSGLVARVLQARDPFMTPPEHLNFFTRRGMARLFTTAGLRIERTETFGTLHEEEVRRGMGKHFPRLANHMPGVAIPAVLAFFRALNRLGMGLELECYGRHALPPPHRM